MLGELGIDSTINLIFVYVYSSSYKVTHTLVLIIFLTIIIPL